MALKQTLMPEFTVAPPSPSSASPSWLPMGAGTFFLILGSGEACGKFQWNVWTPLELDLFVSVDEFIMESPGAQWSQPLPPRRRRG